jgi:hypothetical protein
MASFESASQLNFCGRGGKEPRYGSSGRATRKKEGMNHHRLLLALGVVLVTENFGPEGAMLFCLLDPPPTRNAAINMFIEWTKARPQYMVEKPVETEFQFVTEQWPCKK